MPSTGSMSSILQPAELVRNMRGDSPATRNAHARHGVTCADARRPPVSVEVWRTPSVDSIDTSTVRASETAAPGHAVEPTAADRFLDAVRTHRRAPTRLERRCNRLDGWSAGAAMLAVTSYVAAAATIPTFILPLPLTLIGIAGASVVTFIALSGAKERLRRALKQRDLTADRWETAFSAHSAQGQIPVLFAGSARVRRRSARVLVKKLVEAGVFSKPKTELRDNRDPSSGARRQLGPSVVRVPTSDELRQLTESAKLNLTDRQINLVRVALAQDCLEWAQQDHGAATNALHAAGDQIRSHVRSIRAQRALGGDGQPMSLEDTKNAWKTYRDAATDERASATVLAERRAAVKQLKSLVNAAA